MHKAIIATGAALVAVALIFFTRKKTGIALPFNWDDGLPPLPNFQSIYPVNPGEEELELIPIPEVALNPFGGYAGGYTHPETGVTYFWDPTRNNYFPDPREVFNILN